MLKIEYKTLNNGLEIPLLGFGTARMRGKECQEAVTQALLLGYRLIDTAQMYYNETDVAVGISEASVKRDEIFLTTKFYGISKTKDKIKAAIEKSLKTLKTDYLDLVLIHEPYPEASEMYSALEDAYEEKIIKAIGISNFHNEGLSEFLNKCRIKPMVDQIELHPYCQQKTTLEILERDNIQAESWAPLGQKRIDFLSDETLNLIARAHKKTVAQVILRWIIEKGIVTIPKSTDIKHMKENLDVFSFTLSQNEIDLIDSLDQNKSFFGWY